MNELMSALIGVSFGAFGGGLIFFYFYRKQSRWDALRKAGINALSVADAVHSNMNWKEKDTDRQIPMVKQCVDIVFVRQTLNELALTCRRPDTVNAFMVSIGLTGIAGEEEISGDSIVDLRNAIRKELGFEQALKMNRENAFIAVVPGAKVS